MLSINRISTDDLRDGHEIVTDESGLRARKVTGVHRAGGRVTISVEGGWITAPDPTIIAVT